MENRRPTQQDVAEAAGVSIMTVSRVIRGHASVKEATVKRVREAILRLGYRPDPTLSALVAYRSVSKQPHTSFGIAFIDCDSLEFGRDAMLPSISEEATLLGYTLETHAIPKTITEQRTLSRMLYHRGVRGLIFGPAGKALHFEGWDWDKFALISVGALSHTPKMNTIAISYFQAAYTGARALSEKGAKRIALMVEQSYQMRTARRWIGGYAAWALEHDRSVLHCNIEGGLPAWKAWIEKKRPDAVLTIHGQLSAYLKEVGIPVYIMTNFPANRAGDAFFESDYSQAGRESVRALHQAILRGELGIPERTKAISIYGDWRPIVGP